MKSLLVAACLILLGTVSCASNTEEKRIADGVYRSPSKTEMVAIRGREIEFQIRVSDGQKEQVIHRKYPNYALLSDGKFWPTPTASVPIRSADYFLGVGRFELFWDGTEITRKDPKTGDVVTFAREANAQK
jgi:hypothetical protein